MVCISELRGLQNFQARHPEMIVVAMNVLQDEHAKDAIDRLIRKQKLDMLRVAQGREWQDKFRLPEQIPVTVLVDAGKVRIIHDSVMADPVSFLEADLEAIRTNKALPMGTKAR